MKGLDAFGKVAPYTTSIALFRAVHSTSLSGNRKEKEKHVVNIF